MGGIPYLDTSNMLPEKTIGQGQGEIFPADEKFLVRLDKMSFCFAFIARLNDGSLAVLHVPPYELISNSDGTVTKDPRDVAMFMNIQSSLERIRRIGVAKAAVIYNQSDLDMMNSNDSTRGLTPDAILASSFHNYHFPIDLGMVKKHSYDLHKLPLPDNTTSTEMDLLISRLGVQAKHSVTNRDFDFIDIKELFD